jgi:hypothetical protein
VQSLDLSACSMIEIEARVFCARGIVVWEQSNTT